MEGGTGRQALYGGKVVGREEGMERGKQGGMYEGRGKGKE